MKTSTRNRGLGLIALLSVTLPAVAQQFGGQLVPAPTPPSPPTLIKGKLNEWVGGGHALYKVVSYESGLRDYRQKYNQGGRIIHPGFSKDRLAVVELEVRNVTDHPILPPIFVAALTDTDGVRTTEWKLDTRQVSFVTERRRLVREDSSSPAEIAAGQTLKLALIFSISPKARPTLLEFAPENFRDFSFGINTGTVSGPATALPPNRQFGPRPVVGRPVPRVIHIIVDLAAAIAAKH